MAPFPKLTLSGTIPLPVNQRYAKQSAGAFFRNFFHLFNRGPYTGPRDIAAAISAVTDGQEKSASYEWLNGELELFSEV
jgi:hypothetical protein